MDTNPNRIDLDEAYMQMAEVWAKRSKANRKQVGAIIVKDRQIISDGYNGMPAGEPDDSCEYVGTDGQLHTKPEVLHAESNALTKIAENGGIGAQGATLYVTMSPCFQCAKLIKQSKIRRVVFREIYRDTEGLEFLASRGIEVTQLAAAAIQPSTIQEGPAPTAVRQTPRTTPSNQMRTLAAIANLPPGQMPAPHPVPTPPPAVVEPPTMEPTIEQGPMPTEFTPPGEDEVQALLRQHEAMLRAQAGGPPVPKQSSMGDDAPYQSSFA